MSADGSILLRFAGDDPRRSLQALLRELFEKGRIETPQVRPLVDGSGTSPTKGDDRGTATTWGFDEGDWSRPDVINGRDLVWVTFSLGSGRTVSTYVTPLHDPGQLKAPSTRFCFVRDDMMEMFHRCWDGESYAVDCVLSAIEEWEAYSRELFTCLCATGDRYSVEHAAMSMTPDWVGPEACSMVFHADAREVLLDIVRAHLSMARGVPANILSQALELGAQDARALAELATAEHARHVHDLRQDLRRRSPPLEGIGMTRVVGRAGSMECRRIGEGVALMTNPLATLAYPYQLLYETLAAFNRA